MARQPDGRILAEVSSVGCFRLVRLFSDGAVDPAFHPATTEGVSTVQVLRDQKLLVIGGFAMVNGSTRRGLARLGADGALDESFVPFASGWSVDSAIVQADGKVVVVQSIRDGLTPPRLVRLNLDGSLDAGFSSDLLLHGVGDRFYSLLAHADGSFWVVAKYSKGGQDLLRLHGDVLVLRLRRPFFSADNGGQTEIGCVGPPGRGAVLEAASSLSPGLWHPIATNTFGPAGEALLRDTPSSRNAQVRFYRAVLR